MRRGSWLVALVIVLAVLTATGVPGTGPLADPTDGKQATPAGSQPAADNNHAGDADTEPAGSTATSDSRPKRLRIVAVYPNPVPSGDRGEFVAIRFPANASEGTVSLGDGEDTTAIDPPPDGGLLYLSTEPAATRRLGFTPVSPMTEPLALANGGETLTLYRNGTAVSTVSYSRAPESRAYRRAPEAGGWRWEPIGLERRPVWTAEDVPVRAFVLPDAPNPALGLVENASDRVYLAGYTFGSWPLARALARAHDRGVRVRVLLDGGPVGGITARQHRQLQVLAERGVEVRVIGGPYARVTYHHAKYAVVDDRAVVLSENWKPAGTGGHSSRGWGATIEDPEAAATLARLFRADAGWLDARNWSTVAADVPTVEANASDGTFQTHHLPTRMTATRVQVGTTPGPGDELLEGLIRGADESIRIQQVTIGSPEFGLLEATVDAARRGVRVRILLSRAWYAREDNQALARHLRRLADRENLPIEVRLVTPRGRFEKTHVKGVIVDGETVVLGSLNWNRHAATENRELVVALTGPEVGAYYVKVFEADWRGGGTTLPLSVLVAVAVAVAGAVRVGSRIRFGVETADGAIDPIGSAGGDTGAADSPAPRGASEAPE